MDCRIIFPELHQDIIRYGYHGEKFPEDKEQPGMETCTGNVLPPGKIMIPDFSNPPILSKTTIMI